jgi:hypothetical protein
MTQPICLIGNSHLAAIKLAWDAMREQFPHLELEMFGSHSASLRDTALDSGRIVPTTKQVARNFKWTSRTNAIRLNKYAAFYIVAGGFSSLPIFSLYSEWGYYELNGRRKYLVSQDCFRRAAIGWLRAVPAMHLLRLVRSGSDAPIYLCAQPLPSDECLGDPNCDIAHKNAIANHDDGKLFDLYLDLCRELTGENVFAIQQPDWTKSGIALTKGEYSRNSVGLTPKFDLEHPPNDYFHMNRLYGAEMLKAMFGAADSKSVEHHSRISSAAGAPIG